ncbi:hypothetical protein ACOSQ3_032326 [Xanthoceras sorbifolium]
MLFITVLEWWWQFLLSFFLVFSQQRGWRVFGAEGGLMLAKNHQLKVRWVETDAANVAMGVKVSSAESGVAASIVSVIRACFEEVGVVQC